MSFDFLAVGVMAQCTMYVALRTSNSFMRDILARYVLVMRYGHLTLLTARNGMSAMDITDGTMCQKNQ